MNRNLILSAALGYNFQQVEFFIKSLRKYYHDEVCFIIDHKNDDLEKELKKYNCNIIKTRTNKKEIQFKRYEIFSKYIKNKNYNNILLCDSRDIYFQADPFRFKYKGPINFFLEDYQIKNCSYNSNWLLKTYGKTIFNDMRDEIILCSGTVLGTHKRIKEYLNLIKNYIYNFKYKKKLKYLLTFRPDPEARGCDQGHANYLVHKKIIKDFYLYSNSGGPFATVFYLKKIKFDNESRLINDSGKPYLLVHQFDKRWDEFSQNVGNFKNNL